MKPEIKSERTDLRCLVYTSVSHMANDGNFLLYSLLIVYYNSDMGLSKALLGIGAVGSNLLSGLMSGPIGAFAQKTGRIGHLIALGIFLEGISALMFSLPFFFHNLTYWFIFLSAGLLGLGQAFYHPLGASMINETYGSERAPRYLGINGSFGSIGRSIFPLIIGSFVLLFGYGHGMQYFGIITISLSLIIFSGLRPLSTGVDASKGADNAESNGGKVSLGKYRFFIWYLTAVVFVRSAFYVGSTTYLADYVNGVVNSAFITSIILTVSFIPPILGQPYFGNMMTRRGGRYVILLTGYISLVSFAVFLLVRNDILLTLVLGIYAFVAFTGFPVLLGYVGQRVPKKILPFSNSIVWGVGNTIGSSAGAGLMVLLLQFTNLRNSFWILLVLGIASMVAFQFEPIRNRKMEEIRY